MSLQTQSNQRLNILAAQSHPAHRLNRSVMTFPDLRSGRNHTAPPKLTQRSPHPPPSSPPRGPQTSGSKTAQLVLMLRSRFLLLTGPHTFTASFCHAPAAPHGHTSPCRNATAVAPQIHGAVKASVPKRFGLSRCYSHHHPQNYAEPSAGFIIPQIAPLASQAPAASVAHSGSPFQEASLTTLKTYNTARLRSQVLQALRPLRRSSIS